jgi:hypothetical protein
MAQKGTGGNSGAITKKGGDGAHGSTGTGRGGGKSGGGQTGARTKKGAGADDQRGKPSDGNTSDTLEQVQADAARRCANDGGYQ